MCEASGFRIGLYEKALPAGRPWEDVLQLARRAGYNFFEIAIDESDARLERLDWSRSQRAMLRQAVANTDIPIMTLCLSAHRKYPLGSASIQTRMRGLDILRQAIDFAEDIGIRVVQVMGYDVYYEPADAATADRFVRGLECGAGWAAQSGVMLGLENVDCAYVDSVSKALRIMQALNSPWFQLYPDMGNLSAFGYRPADELRLAAGHLIGVHVKDALPGIIRGVPFGQGHVSFAETFGALAAIGFQGLLTVEMWADKAAASDPLTTTFAAHSFVEGLVAAAWASSPRLAPAFAGKEV